jgi:Nucleotide modification associated domain 2
MSRIYRYKLVTDSGMAPCPNGGLLSLATCKPGIRAGARDGDWVVGFYPAQAPPGIVAWAGRVARSIAVGDYEREFEGRPDAVYRQKPEGGFKRLRPDYHPGDDQFRKDVSSPVLVFDPEASWYFGDNGQVFPEHLMHLAATIRNYHVNGVRDGDTDALETWLRGAALPGIHGSPRHPPSPRTSRRC